MKLTIKDAAFHRNGVGGLGFYAIYFHDQDQGDMFAALFDEPGACAVVNVKQLAAGDVAFGSNSWRGDHYEAGLRPLIEKWSQDQGTGRIGPFSAIPPEAARAAIAKAKVI